MDLNALFKLSYGLYMVGAKENEKLNGCIVNTVTQVSNDPVKITVTISKANYTHDMIRDSGYFTVSVFGQDATLESIGNFGFKSGRTHNKFSGIDYMQDEHGCPYIEKDMLSVLCAHVTGTLDVGTHTVFLADVEDAKLLSDAEPMTYAYYRKVKNGTVPRNAPTFKKPGH